MQVRPLGPEDPLEEEMATHMEQYCQVHMGRGASLAEVHGVAKSQTQLTEHSLKGRWDT